MLRELFYRKTTIPLGNEPMYPEEYSIITFRNSKETAHKICLVQCENTKSVKLLTVNLFLYWLTHEIPDNH